MAIQRALFVDTVTVLPFGSFNPAFTSVVTYSPNVSSTNPSPLGFIAILVLGNYTNQDIELNFGAPLVTHMYLRAGERREINFRAAGLLWMGQIFARHTAVAPTSGNLYVEAIRSSQ